MDDEAVTISLKLKELRKFLADTRAGAGGLDTMRNATERADKRSRSAAVGFGLFTGGVRKLIGMAALASTALVGLATVGIVGSARAFAEAEVVGAKVNAVIKATGGIAKVSAKDVDRFANTMAMKTGIDDESIASAEALLLTFKGVRNGVGTTGDMFQRASRAALDLSVATGKDLNSSVVAIGKALQDPAKGAVALSKGGSLAKTELAQLQKMAKAGEPIWKQQEFILNALEGQYKGTAEAAGNTFQGAMNRAKVMVGNVGEAIGALLAPKLTWLVDNVTKASATFQRARDKGASFGFAVATALDSVTGGGDRFRTGFIKVRGVLERVWNMGKNLAAGLRDIVVALNPFDGHAEDSASAVGKLFDKLEAATVQVRKFGKWMRDGGKGADRVKFAVYGVVTALAVYRAAMVVSAAVTKGVAMAETAYIVGLYAVSAAQTVAAAVTGGFTVAMVALNLAFLANPIGVTVLAVAAFVGILVLAYKKVSWFRTAVNATFGFFAKYVPQVFGMVVGFIRDHWGLIVSIIGGPLGIIVVQVIKHFGDIVRFVKSVPAMIGKALHGMWDGVKTGFTSAFNWVFDKLAHIKFSFPGFDPPGPGPKIPGFDVTPFSGLPHLAMGGVLLEGGSVVVGDGGNGSGAEVVDLPRGARVRPLSDDERRVTPRGGMGASGGSGTLRVVVPVTIDGRVVAQAVADVTADDLARR